MNGQFRVWDEKQEKYLNTLDCYFFSLAKSGTLWVRVGDDCWFVDNSNLGTFLSPSAVDLDALADCVFTGSSLKYRIANCLAFAAWCYAKMKEGNQATRIKELRDEIGPVDMDITDEIRKMREVE